MKGKITIVVGGGHGSESKGLVVGKLALDGDYSYAVRTGSIQAGHSVYYKGKRYVGRTIPVAWVNPSIKLVVGAGAYINPRVLGEEVQMIADATNATTEEVKARLFIDFRAGIHTDEHHKTETNSGIHERMGSTGEGVAEAIKDKMNRRGPESLFSNTEHVKGYQIVDTVRMLNEAYDLGEQILIEGTQGTMLDLHLGDYPFVTSRQTIAGAWLTETGLSPKLDTEVVMVTRYFPIRVAGNSGPLPNEIDWVPFMREVNEKREAHGLEPIVKEWAISSLELALKQKSLEFGMDSIEMSKYTPEERIKQAKGLSNVYKEALESLPEATLAELKKLLEMTTVTKKVRRLARLDLEQLKYAVMLNRPDYLVLTFLEYGFPTLFGVQTWDGIKESPEWDEIRVELMQLEEATGVPIKYVNTMPDDIIETV